MDHLDPKRLGFVIYLGLRIHQFQKYHLWKGLKQGCNVKSMSLKWHSRDHKKVGILWQESEKKYATKSTETRVSVQGVVSLGGHFATLCREFDFYEVKKKYYYFSKRKWKYFYTFTLKFLLYVPVRMPVRQYIAM